MRIFGGTDKVNTVTGYKIQKHENPPSPSTESIVDTYAIKGQDLYNSPHSPPINYVISCENYKAKPKEEQVTGIVRQTLTYENSAQYMQHEITAMPASSDSSERHNNHCKGISITETTDNNIVFKQYPIKETRKPTIPLRQLVIPGPGYDMIMIGYPNTYST